MILLWMYYRVWYMQINLPFKSQSFTKLMSSLIKRNDGCDVSKDCDNTDEVWSSQGMFLGVRVVERREDIKHFSVKGEKN